MKNFTKFYKIKCKTNNIYIYKASPTYLYIAYAKEA